MSSVTVAGHIEGSLIGMVAARKAGADAFVSIAGAGRPVQHILVEQLKPMLPPALMASAESIMAELAAGKTVDTVPPELNAVFRRSVQPYLISWLRYDPPILVVHGTTDIQATSADAELLSQSNKSAKMSIIEGMNHVFKTVPSDRAKQIASYSDPSLPVEPKLINDIAGFVQALRK
ncbi:MAG: hypothetical protein WKF92_09325 [Pyrinomonadaceae bacterium]